MDAYLNTYGAWGPTLVFLDPPGGPRLCFFPTSYIIVQIGFDETEQPVSWYEDAGSIENDPLLKVEDKPSPINPVKPSVHRTAVKQICDI